ncbi:MAG TPA: VCBS repeat-containing protein, partial [candidate division Zixibacteria bacterium]|nr:VCBS repeat-containing protein [candidate division Zixibacteria bacterium]
MSYDVGNTPASIVAADLDGDGRPDLVVANFGNGTVSVLRNHGDGTFASKVDYSIGLPFSYPKAVFAADFTGDGKPDVSVANSGTHTVRILKNNGDGTLSANVEYGTGDYPTSVIGTDLNGDGKPDLAVASTFNTVSVLLNNGDGTFRAKVDYGTGIYPTSVIGADLDGDGKADLAVANSDDNTVSVLKNNGDGTFAAKVDYGTGSNPLSVFAAD